MKRCGGFSISVDITLAYALLVFFGFLIGVLVATMGGGGGFFYVPLLTLGFNVPIQIAVSTSLASIVPTTLIASLSHYKAGNVRVGIGVIFIAGGIVGAFSGAYLSQSIPAETLTRLFGGLMLAMALPMARRAHAGPSAETRTLTPVKLIVGAGFGVLSGLMAGLFGVSGTPPIIAGLYILGLSAVSVVGTSVFILMFNAVAGLAGHAAVAQLDLLLIVLLGGGAALGAFLGPKLLGRVDPQRLERGFGTLFLATLVIVGIIMLVG